MKPGPEPLNLMMLASSPDIISSPFSRYTTLVYNSKGIFTYICRQIARRKN